MANSDSASQDKDVERWRRIFKWIYIVSSTLIVWAVFYNFGFQLAILCILTFIMITMAEGML